MERNVLPTHVAIIMDGNGRWAKLRGLERSAGHVAGAKNVASIAEYLFSKGVTVVTLYAFSEENFSRPTAEVEGILSQISNFATDFPKRCGGRVKLAFLGDLSKVGDELKRACERAEHATQNNAPCVLNILLNYGGRTEIIRAARLLCGEEVTEDSFRKGLYSNALPDPDLIIRTGGEKRLSGFMPFQSCYSELYFCDTLFPDFSSKDVDEALADYAKRERRYGGI